MRAFGSRLARKPVLELPKSCSSANTAKWSMQTASSPSPRLRRIAGKSHKAWKTLKTSEQQEPGGGVVFVGQQCKLADALEFVDEYAGEIGLFDSPSVGSLTMACAAASTSAFCFWWSRL